MVPTGDSKLIVEVWKELDFGRLTRYWSSFKYHSRISSCFRRQGKWMSLWTWNRGRQSTITSSLTYPVIVMPLSPAQLVCSISLRRGFARDFVIWRYQKRCTTYQEFYEVLLRVEDFEYALSDNDVDEGVIIQRKNNRGQSCFSSRRNLSIRGTVTFLDPLGGSNPSTAQSRGKSIGNSHFHIQEVLISIQLRSHNIREAIHNTRGGGAHQYGDGQYQTTDVASNSGGQGRQSGRARQR